MALQQRTRILPQQRLDLPDYRNIEDFVCADFKAMFKFTWTSANFVVSGFDATGVGTTDLSVVLAGSSLIVGQDDGTMFIGAPSLSPLTTDALTPSSTNFVELTIDQDTGGADSRAFWDQTAAGGAGGEFSQIVDTFTFQKANFSINTSAFTGDADKVPICEVDVNASGVITEIRDSRNLFWRLGRASDPTFDFPWVSRVEPPNTQFTGADKDIDTFKQWADAVMSAIREIKGSTYWFEAATITAPSVLRATGFSTIAPLTAGARVVWDGSNLMIRDDSLTPAGSDNLAAVRLFDVTTDLFLTRQDDGKEIVTVTLDAEPDAGVLTLDQNGNLVAINFNDSTATIQSTWDGSGAAAATITGDLISQKLTITFNAAGNQVDVITNANTLTKNAVAVVETITIKQGQASDESIAIADGEVLWVELPDPLANTTYSDVGVIQSNYRVSARGSVPFASSSFWLAYREGSKLIWRFLGELEAGESSQIGDNVPQSLLNNIGLVDEVTPPAYSSNIRGTQGESIVARVGELTDAMGDAQEDRSAFLRSDEVVTWTGTQLEFTTDIVLEIINTKDATLTLHSIPLAQSPIAIADGESIYVEVDRTDPAETLTVVNSGTTPIPAQTQGDKDIFVLFKRIDAAGVQVLHLPFHKQALDPGQTVRLGASGSGSGAGSDIASDYKRRLALSPFKRVSVNAFPVDKDTFVDVSSTGAFAPAKSAFEFTAASQFLLDTQNLDADFLDDGLFPRQVEVYVQWLAGEIDTAATYELSLNGGTAFETIEMARVAETNAFRGILELADPANDNLQENPVANDDSDLTLNTTTTQFRAQQITVANTQNVRNIEVYLNKLGAPLGDLLVRIRRDDSGAPSTSSTDIVSTARIDIASLSAGDSTVQADVSDTVLTPGTYWITFEPDSDYAASFSLGVDELRVRADSSAPAFPDSQVFNGTTWSAVAGTALVYLVQGIELDLRLRVTASAASSIESYGVFYEVVPGVTSSASAKVDRVLFSGDENKTSFPLTFTPHPDFLEILDFQRGQIYFVDNDRIRLNGDTVEVAPDFFDFPGETILVMFRQTDTAVIDESAENANKIATIEAQLVDIGDELESISDSLVLTKVPVANTEIQNRRLIPDMSDNLNMYFGGHRIMTNKSYRIADEFGPNGEEVHGIHNDIFDQVRLVGPWNNNTDLLSAQISLSGGEEGFIEVAFHGTSLNMLTIVSGNRPMFVTIDGGAESGNIYPASGSAILENRRLNSNAKINITSGLSAGPHTAKIRFGTGDSKVVFGFEVLNDEANGNIIVKPGSQLFKGRKLTLATEKSLSRNSGYESGSLGTKGGCVDVYHKSDGDVAHAVNPTDVAAAFLGAANHGNEDMVREVFYREMGMGRTDDCSLLFPSAEDSAWTADDNNTQLSLHDMANNSAHIDGMFPNGVSNSLFRFSFVGSGLDMEMFTVGSPATVEVFVNGVSQGNLVDPGLGDDVRFTHKIASGLPMGEHIVELRQAAVGNPSNTFYFDSFKIYAPKAPSIPAGAKTIGRYYVLADYSFNTNQNYILERSDGTVRNFNVRESTYIGTWTINGIGIDAGADSSSGFLIAAQTSGAASETKRFFGTGCDIRQFADPNRHDTVNVLIDGVQFTSANFPGASATFSGTAGTGFNFTTGVLDQEASGTGELVLSITGLSEGEHELTLSAATTSGSDRLAAIDALDVHASTYAYRTFGPDLIQGIAMAGNQGLLDLRRFSRKDIPTAAPRAESRSVGTFSSSFTTQVPTENSMRLEVKEEGNYRLNATFINTGGSNSSMFWRFIINGRQLGAEMRRDPSSSGANLEDTMSFHDEVFLKPGVYHINLSVRNSNGVGTNTFSTRLSAERRN